MKKLLLINVILIIYSLVSDAQEITYRTGQWDPEGLGNHRAVIYIGRPSGAVRVNVPWRRLDSVENKNLILIDALTNQRVKNIYCTQKNKDFGEIVFQPVSGPGYYYLYYMPGQHKGSVWFPDVVYEKPTDTYDINWKNRTAHSINDQVAEAIAFESVNNLFRNDYHSFYPMEIPVTQDELSELLESNRDKEFFIFPEDRNFPARMTETIPLRWYEKGVNAPFEGMALKNESYAWQIGVFSPYRDLKYVELTFSDLKKADGSSVIPADAFKCINMGGTNHLGQEFIKNVTIPGGEVRSMWIITDINKDQPAGVYNGKVEVSAQGATTYTVDVSIEVGEETAEDRGYNTPQNLSRLNWLNSDIGIDNEVVAPFIPVKLSGNTVSILGRELSFNRFGFPEKITSSFTGSNHSIGGDEKNILQGPIHLNLVHEGRPVRFSAREPELTLQSSGAVAWETILSSEDVEISVNVKMECDGYVDYGVIIKANKDVALDDIQLVIPYEITTAKYLMGMGKQGGYTPDKLEWKWQQEYANNMIWIGDVNAGMQIKLKHIVPDWKLFTFEKTGPYRDWSNEGKGGCNVRKTEDSVLVTAYTGTRNMKAGDEMVLNFGLLITPFRTLDDNHWDERYYHQVTNNDPETAADIGATIMNIHHANEYNPFINYPFLNEDRLIPLIEKAKELNIRTKLYYTVRELSTYLPELWALRHLDDEIFTRSREIILADTHETDVNKVMYGMTGHSWLYEHLRSEYDPAWHCPPDKAIGIDWDMSIRTQGVSRWHNYYIKGLDWLVRETGMRGLYLDGVGYDRDIMKRVRKTMDRAADSCLIDFHSGNAFHPDYGLNSPANNYMELFPYVNSLWLGEMYDYNMKPDYWLVEISGIIFGLWSEMLQGCGNPYRGMVYGMSNRHYEHCRPGNIWELWDYFGISGSEYIGYWDHSNPVKTGNKAILASNYLHKDRAMVAIGNWTDTDQVIRLEIDWEKLGMDPAFAKIEKPHIDGLQKAGVANVNQVNIPASKGLILIISK